MLTLNDVIEKAADGNETLIAKYREELEYMELSDNDAELLDILYDDNRDLIYSAQKIADGDVYVWPNVYSDTSLGEYLVYELDVFSDVSDRAKDYLDFRKIGQDYRYESEGFHSRIGWIDIA